MTHHPERSATLGDVIIEAFDQASLHCADPLEAAGLATQAVVDLLRHASPWLPVTPVQPRLRSLRSAR